MKVLIVVFGLTLLSSCSLVDYSKSDPDRVTIKRNATIAKNFEKVDQEYADEYCQKYEKRAVYVNHGPFNRVYDCLDYPAFHKYEDKLAAQQKSAQVAVAKQATAQQEAAAKQAKDEERQKEIAQVKQDKEQAGVLQKAKQELDLMDNNTCVSYGVNRGSSGYANCRLKLVEDRRAEFADEERSRVQQQQAAEAQLEQAQEQQAILEQQRQQENNLETLQLYQALQPQPRYYAPTTTNCVKTGTIVNCQSY